MRTAISGYFTYLLYPFIAYPEGGFVGRVVVLAEVRGDAGDVGGPHGRLREADSERRGAVEEDDDRHVGVDLGRAGVVGVEHDARRQRARTHDEQVAVGVDHFQLVETYWRNRRTNTGGPSSVGSIALDDPSPLHGMYRDHNALPSPTDGQTDRRTLTS